MKKLLNQLTPFFRKLRVVPILDVKNLIIFRTFEDNRTKLHEFISASESILFYSFQFYLSFQNILLTFVDLD